MAWERPVHEAGVEVTEPLRDLSFPHQIELLRLSVRIEGDRLGEVEVPVCDGCLLGPVLADAIVEELAWPVLGRFFERTLYPQLRLEPGDGGVAVWRGDLRLAEGPPEDRELIAEVWHDRIGWALLLQEVWGRPEWPESRFYAEADLGAGDPEQPVDGWITVEVGEDLPDLGPGGAPVDVELTVGGVAIGRVTVPPGIEAPALRAALTTAAGFELCRAAVREGLLGQPLSGPPLRDRLATAAARVSPGRPSLDPEALPCPAPGWRQALHRALLGREGLVIARRAVGEIGSASSRRAFFPGGAAGDLAASARVAGDPVLEVPGRGGRLVVYTPDLLWRSPARPLPDSSPPARQGDAPLRDRHDFEVLFASRADPWGYTSPYEQAKYEQTLGLLPDPPSCRALELACAEGLFTRQLAPRVRELIATDISEIALRRAAERCRGCDNVRFLRLDLARDPLPGAFDLIVCSEVLYFVGDRERLAAVARHLADALAPGGHLLMAHANVVVDAPEQTGFDWEVPFGARTIGETFARTGGLRFVRELRTPLYRIQLFRREDGEDGPASCEPEAVETAGHADPDPEVARHILWNGGHPARQAARRDGVDRLPILMYHQIAPEGSPATARYRVSPEAFEEQLRYLRDAGFHGIGLAGWASAMAGRRRLPGRPVVLTFDDGYRDFADHAWPLLRRYGFSATLFLISGEIGGTNRWDAGSGEEVPLLDWPEIRRLRDEGVEIGSHSHTHRRMTGLPNVEVVREAARSRAELERGLGVPVTAFAYPWGLADAAVRHLVRGCGYMVGLTCRPGPSSLYDPPMSLPRIEVSGSLDLEGFIAGLVY